MEKNGGGTSKGEADFRQRQHSRRRLEKNNNDSKNLPILWTICGFLGSCNTGSFLVVDRSCTHFQEMQRIRAGILQFIRN